MERKYCNKPDRHEPKLKCGHPLPCPWHTIIADTETGGIFYPEHSPKDEKTKKRIRDITDTLME